MKCLLLVVVVSICSLPVLGQSNDKDISQPIIVDEWVKISESKKGVSMYCNFARVSLKDNYIVAWIKETGNGAYYTRIRRERKENVTGWQRYSYSLFKFYIDCEKKECATYAVVHYDIDGNVLEQLKATDEWDMKWKIIAPGTQMDELSKMFCLLK